MKPNETTFVRAAEAIGASVAAVTAVFEVEAAGAFYDPSGGVVRRFEPHHFPRGLWPAIGFKPGSRAPWRASLSLSRSKRRRMWSEAIELDAEAAHKAASWGAPQIMGFNHELAGYRSAIDMVSAFSESPDAQVSAFVGFIVSQGLDGDIRAQDWHSFASGYNGPGKAFDYAAKIEEAYRRHSGGKRSRRVLRLGSRGESVRALQTALVELGHLDPDPGADGSFGAATRAAVRGFQRENALIEDGVVGERTWRMIGRASSPPAAGAPRPENQPSAADTRASDIVEKVGPVVGGGVAGNFLQSLSDNSELILIGGVVAAGMVVLAVWAAPRVRRGLL